MTASEHVHVPLLRGKQCLISLYSTMLKCEVSLQNNQEYCTEMEAPHYLESGKAAYQHLNQDVTSSQGDTNNSVCPDKWTSSQQNGVEHQHVDCSNYFEMEIHPILLCCG